jgi:hypothetical protein
MNGCALPDKNKLVLYLVSTRTFAPAAKVGLRPADRARSRYALSFIERDEISRGLVTKLTLRSIAQNLNWPPSTISREARRNGWCYPWSIKK